MSLCVLCADYDIIEWLLAVVYCKYLQFGLSLNKYLLHPKVD